MEGEFSTINGDYIRLNTKNVFEFIVSLFVLNIRHLC
jgi:hypothetical protein